jgi:hypothetical protein
VKFAQVYLASPNFLVSKSVGTNLFLTEKEEELIWNKLEESGKLVCLFYN